MNVHCTQRKEDQTIEFKDKKTQTNFVFRTSTAQIMQQVIQMKTAYSWRFDCIYSVYSLLTILFSLTMGCKNESAARISKRRYIENFEKMKKSRSEYNILMVHNTINIKIKQMCSWHMGKRVWIIQRNGLRERHLNSSYLLLYLHPFDFFHCEIEIQKNRPFANIDDR